MALALFARLRVLSPKESHPVIPTAERARYPALAEDFAVLDDVVAKAFEKSDLSALRNQNRYRNQQLLALGGSVITSGLGGLQALLADRHWPGIALAVCGALLALSSALMRELRTQQAYLAERVKAERLRALHFRFLSRTGGFGDADRVGNLRRAVLDIEAGKEPR
jgi:uncharacterized protein DUF4231